MSNKKSKLQPGTKFAYNVIIFSLAIIVVGFLYSFVQKNFSNGVTLQSPQLNDKQKSKLAIELYEENPIYNIRIEILNGCGEKGIAAKITDYLRSEHIDVIRAENADNFDYESTILIHRSYDLTHLKLVAKALDFDINDANRVMSQSSSNADVDLTLIIGKDYRSVKPLKVYLANLQ